MQLLGVLVSADQVGTGFRARVGAPVPLGLSLRCRRRVVAGPDTGGLVGLVVPAVRDSFYGGWVLRSGGIPFHVTEESAKDEVAFIAEVRARVGLTHVGVEGTVGVAGEQLVEAVRERWGLDLNRSWLVRGIVRISGAGYQHPVQEIEHDPAGRGYLLDLESVPD
ncbi:hypothetical protein [Actinoplanes couchii]|uniref:Uncharacterized protein n=1 Tax=Actinoplanes couchii TaxID=403638 RepID=A0ABQ3XS99_9ACTN|nr:hypothetical protein [Actinoplanes couchii]MDR6317981.1 hypothetical protein [Actinoplanes couchii]GID61391.1 hypothetical protein Aco03nite_097950 [Actinoplanes couchii]